MCDAVSGMPPSVACMYQYWTSRQYIFCDIIDSIPVQTSRPSQWLAHISHSWTPTWRVQPAVGCQYGCAAGFTSCRVVVLNAYEVHENFWARWNWRGTILHMPCNIYCLNNYLRWNTSHAWTHSKAVVSTRTPLQWLRSILIVLYNLEL